VSHVPTIKLLGLALAGVVIAAWIAPGAANADLQLAQTTAEGEAARAAKEIELGEEKARQDDKREARETKERVQEGLRLEGEIERNGRAGEAAQRRTQRRSRFRTIIER
jgi:hypothetical protein